MHTCVVHHGILWTLSYASLQFTGHSSPRIDPMICWTRSKQNGHKWFDFVKDIWETKLVLFYSACIIILCVSKAYLDVFETALYTLFSAAPTLAKISVSSGAGSHYDPNTPCHPTMTLIHGITYVFDCEVTGATSKPEVTWTLTQPSNPVPLQNVVGATDFSVVCNRPSDVKSYTLRVRTD